MPACLGVSVHFLVTFNIRDTSTKPLFASDSAWEVISQVIPMCLSSIVYDS